jgi:hypothetical protein
MRPAAPLLLSAAIAAAQPGAVLFDFDNGFPLTNAKGFGSTVTLASQAGNAALAVDLKDAAGWEGVNLTLSAKDASGARGVMMVVRNTGTQPLSLQGSVNDDGNYPSNTGWLRLEKGASDTLFVHFHRNTPPTYLASYFTGMKGLPGGYTPHWEVIDLSHVTQVQVSAFSPGPGRSFTLDDVRLWGAFDPPTEAQLKSGFFPLLDTLGQYRNAAWPGKAEGAAALQAQRDAEAADLAAHASPEGWDAYGGWADGPKRDATGHFRAEKIDGKWWLVDPDGRLFWSNGITCVNSGETTPVAGRESYFANPPANGDYRAANLKRKFGSTWYNDAAALAHKRFRSWGLNTFGNWSDKGIYGLKKTPYTVNFATGLAQNLPATFDTAAFRATVRKAIAALAPQVGSDPWCLGVFSDNELNWPAATAATLAEDYYRIVSQEMKAGLPGVMYLGSRIHVAPEAVWRAAGKYLDVIAHNRYDYSLIGLPLPAGVDKPVMITEFHYGALDRGLPHTGLRAAFNQRQRALLYAGMLDECLLHPNLVGAHWFQYNDNIYTGRFDGENYNDGFLDVCDRPYPEMVAAARAVGYRLYATRNAGAVPQALSPSLRTPAGALVPGPLIDALGRRGRAERAAMLRFRLPRPR